MFAFGVKKWLPLQDSNLDKLIQSQLCYHYTKRQERGGIIGGRPPERKRKNAVPEGARKRAENHSIPRGTALIRSSSWA